MYELLVFSQEQCLLFALVVSRDILLRILSCFLFWIVSGQTLEFKLHSRILYFELIHRVTFPNFFVFLVSILLQIFKNLNSCTKQNKKKNIKKNNNKWKKHSKFNILLIFSVNKQTKHFFFYFNYYQLRMVFFSIIKSRKNI